MKIKNLPIEIQELVKIRYLEEEGNMDEFDLDNHLSHTLSYSDTKERFYFWRKIEDGKFDEFYKLYPHTKKQTKLSPYIKSGNKIIYYATIKGKKATVTIEYEE